jgi:hypothetical protein
VHALLCSRQHVTKVVHFVFIQNGNVGRAARTRDSPKSVGRPIAPISVTILNSDTHRGRPIDLAVLHEHCAKLADVFLMGLTLHAKQRETARAGKLRAERPLTSRERASHPALVFVVSARIVQGVVVKVF